MAHHEADNEAPVTELTGFTDPAAQELPARVRRSINRHLLLADSLDLTLGAMLATAWHFLQTLLDALDRTEANPEEPFDD